MGAEVLRSELRPTPAWFLQVERVSGLTCSIKSSIDIDWKSLSKLHETSQCERLARSGPDLGSQKSREPSHYISISFIEFFRLALQEPINTIKFLSWLINT